LSRFIGGQFAEKDEETGLDHFEARDYDSRLGRWLNPDPAGQHWSPYLAMGNNPVSGVDPDGRKWINTNGDLIWDNGTFTNNATRSDRYLYDAMMLTPTGQKQFDYMVNSKYYFTITILKNHPEKSLLGHIKQPSNPDDKWPTLIGYKNSKEDPFKIELFEDNIINHSVNKGLPYMYALSATLGHEIEHGKDRNMQLMIKMNYPLLMAPSLWFTEPDFEIEANLIGNSIRRESFNQLRDMQMLMQMLIPRPPLQLGGRKTWYF
jgi:RHS repeat-associated protein